MKKRFEKLLELLCESGWITAKCADRAKGQYSELIGSQMVIGLMKDFNILEHRVDEFYMEELFAGQKVGRGCEALPDTVSWKCKSRVRFFHQ